MSGSYDRKGVMAFVRERIIRMGVSLVLGCLFLFGPIAVLSSGSQTGLVDFLLFQYIGQWQIKMEHLWFISRLLFLSILYDVWRAITSAQI